MVFTLTSPVFTEADRIQDKYTCEGDNISPSLDWTGPPKKTQSFALFCNDPDAPRGIWHHWALFDIPAHCTHLKSDATAEFSEGYREAINDFGQKGYGGPCPPPGHGVHRYQFRLVALEVKKLELSARPKCPDVEIAAAPHILDESILVGTFSR